MKARVLNARHGIVATAIHITDVKGMTGRRLTRFLRAVSPAVNNLSRIFRSARELFACNYVVSRNENNGVFLLIQRIPTSSVGFLLEDRHSSWARR